MKLLDDVRVLDLTHVWFGPWCTMMMAEMGAEVIRVEPPWGAIDRIAEGALFGGASYTFHHLNLNKKDLTLDLKSQEGLELLKELVKVSDVVIQNFSPGTIERLGLGYEVLKELNPSIIYAALSGVRPVRPLQDAEVVCLGGGGHERPHPTDGGEARRGRAARPDGSGPGGSGAGDDGCHGDHRGPPVPG